MNRPRAQVTAMLPLARLIALSAVEVLTAPVDAGSRQNARRAVADLQVSPASAAPSITARFGR